MYCKRYLLAGSFSIFLSCALWALFWLDLCTLFCFVALPDLIIDTKELKRVMRLDSERLQRLRCAHEENCLAKSADVLFSPRYVYPLFYSSFNTHPKVMSWLVTFWKHATKNWRFFVLLRKTGNKLHCSKWWTKKLSDWLRSETRREEWLPGPHLEYTFSEENWHARFAVTSPSHSQK